MAIAQLANVLKFFGIDAGEPDPQEKQALVREALLMTLARATNADTNVKTVEVETVRRIYQEATGHEVSSKDVRMAANADLFDEAPLDQYLSRIHSKIDDDDQRLIVRSLAQVIKADGRISPLEVDFFNDVVGALRMTPDQITGLLD